LRAQALATSLNLVFFPQHDPLTHKHFFRNLVLGHAREHFRAICALAPFSTTPISFDATLTFTMLHFNSCGYFPLILEAYELDQDLNLSSNSFKQTFQHMPHPSKSGLSRIIFEHLKDCFHLENLMSGFLKLF
jgi:hypothetical protein